MHRICCLIENRRLSLRFFDIFAVYVLRNHGAGLLFYEKTEVWIESENLYEVLYTFEMEVY